jgi:hypothetical protein
MSALAKTILIGLFVVPGVVLSVGFSLLMSWPIILVTIGLAILAVLYFKKAIHCTGQIINRIDERKNFIILSWLALPFVLLTLGLMVRFLFSNWQLIGAQLLIHPLSLSLYLSLYILIQDTILLLKKIL